MDALPIYNKRSIQILDGILHYAPARPDAVTVETEEASKTLTVTVFDADDSVLAVATVGIQVDPHLYFCVLGVARKHLLGIAKEKEVGHE